MMDNSAKLSDGETVREKISNVLMDFAMEHKSDTFHIDDTEEYTDEIEKVISQWLEEVVFAEGRVI